MEWWKERFTVGLSHPGSTESDVAVCRSPHAHTHTHTHEQPQQTWTCVSQSKQQLFASKSGQSRERIKSSVWAKPYRQSVKHNRGCEEGHSLSLFFSFSLSQPLFFHKECVSHIVRCVSISNCSDGWRWTDRKEEWDGNLVSQTRRKRAFYYNSITALSELRHGLKEKLLLNLHTLWKMKLFWYTKLLCSWWR